VPVVVRVAVVVVVVVVVEEEDTYSFTGSRVGEAYQVPYH
jgi:hypothetical protein